MGLSTVLGAVVLGALALASPVEAQRSRSNQSTARCRAVSIGFSEVSNKEARADAAADAAAYLCSKDGGQASAEAIAQATAKAYALAVTAASADCSLDGVGEIYANAYSNAQASADVWLSAYAEAVASADVCDKCSAFVEFFAHIEKKVFLSAVASSKATISGYSTTPTRKIAASVFSVSKDIEVAVATAFASALADARQDGLSECTAEVGGGGCTGESANPDCFECSGVSVNFDVIKEIDSIAIAIADAAAYTCGDGHAFAKAKAVAKAVAEATAVAVTFVAADCKLEGYGYACGFAEGEATAVAQATATAFAEGWATAINCDGCYIDAEDTAKSVGNILVTAVSEAYTGLCIDGAGEGKVVFFDASALSVAISEASITAVAEVVAQAISSSGPDSCSAAVDANAST